MGIDLVSLVSSLVVLLVSLSVHESAHAWTADRLGDPTARHLGRISINPLVHADFFGTFLFPLMGFMFGGIIFGWAKPVPVNTARLNNPKRDYMLVAAAGPVANLLMAGGLLLVLGFMKSTSASMELLLNQVVRGVASGDGILVLLLSMAYFGVMINLILAIFNMIPVAPLDGAAVLSGLLPQSLSQTYDALQRYGFIILIALLYLGIPGYLFSPVIGFVQSFLVF
jgi:Zn-dependent protease